MFLGSCIAVTLWHPQRRWGGLGISIVKGIVELVDGQLRLRSKPGLGTTVTLL
jgi:signal transduction histidine kinase